MTLTDKIQKLGIKFIALEKNGTRVIPFNKQPGQLRTRLKEIESMLEIYPTDKFVLTGRKEMRSGNTIEEVITYAGMEGVAEEYDTSAPELNESALEVEVRFLKEQIAEQDSYIEELENELKQYREAPGQLAANDPPVWVNTLIQLGAGLMDKYMSQRDMQLEIERRKLEQLQKEQENG